MVRYKSNIHSYWYIQLILQVIEKALDVGADSSQFPSNWIFHSREKKPGKAFVDGLIPDFQQSVFHQHHI